MTILFMILKIIGIILLVVLGILLLLILTVLFAPVRYKGQGRLQEDLDPEVMFNATYLLSLISVRITYRNQNPSGVLRILFLKKGLFGEKQNKEEDRHAESSKKKTENRSKSTREKKNPAGFLMAIPAMIGELQKEENKEAFHLCIQQLKYLCRHFGPHKIKGNLRFCLGDPCYTGLALGAISMFPVLYKNEFHISPDFESEQIYANGMVSFSGHIRFVHGLVCFIRLWKNKTIRRLFLRGGQSNVRK